MYCVKDVLEMNALRRPTHSEYFKRQSWNVERAGQGPAALIDRYFSCLCGGPRRHRRRDHGLLEGTSRGFCGHAIELHTMPTGRPLQFRPMGPTRFFQEQAQCLGPYTPDPRLTSSFEDPQYQPRPSTGIGPTIHTGWGISKGNPAADTSYGSTLTKQVPDRFWS